MKDQRDVASRPFQVGDSCPLCGSGSLLLAEQPEEFEYKGRRLTLPLERFQCTGCEETFVDDRSALSIEPRLRLWHREVDGLLAPEEVRAIRQTLGVTQRQMAAIIGGGPKAFAKYETGAVNQSQAVDVLLRAVRRHPDTFYRLARERGIEVGLEPIRLHLVWKAPKTRARYVVGELRRDSGGYHFRYESTLPRSLEEAKTAGFQWLDAFPDISSDYIASELFPVFRRRLPPPESPLWERFNLSPGQDLEYLRLTGGRLPSDTLEFLEPIDKGDVVDEWAVTFPIAGWRYYNGEQVMGELLEGTNLRLELEPDNPRDENAVRILSPSGEKVGYVPAIYAWYIDEVVVNNGYEARIQRIGPPDDPQIRVIVRLHARVSFLRALRLPKIIAKYEDLNTVITVSCNRAN